MEIKLLDMHASIIIEKEANRKMELIVDLCSTEVGWLGLVKREGPLRFRVIDVFLVDQEVNSATTELSPSSVNALDRSLWAAGIRTMENQKDIGLFLWGHSHVNMTTGPSGQDVNQFKDLYDAGPSFYIRLITNKKREINVALFVNMDPFGRVIFSDVSWKVEDAAEDGLSDALKKELEEKVKPLVYKGVHTGVSYGKKDYGIPERGAGNQSPRVGAGGVNPSDAEYIYGMWDDYDRAYPGVHNYNREPLGPTPKAAAVDVRPPSNIGEISRTRIIRTNGPVKRPQ
jgi:hypothetical protein